MKKKILLIDDDVLTLKILTSNLENSGFLISTATDGRETLKHLEAYRDITACILDLNLPDINGLELLKIIRTHSIYNQIPVIMLSSTNNKIDVILALEMGADDYMTKPFEGRELVARLHAIYRRMNFQVSRFNSPLIFNDLEIDIDKRLVKNKGNILKLSIKEYEVLVFLAKNAGRVLSREIIMNKIWGEDYIAESRTIDMHISSLRKKIGDKHGFIIETIKGVGYRLVQ